MTTNALSVKYFNYLRGELNKKWNSGDYRGVPLTASGMKNVIKHGLIHLPDSKKDIIRSFLEYPDIIDYAILNKCKCIENFYKNKTSYVSEHTLKFIVNFFDIEIKSVVEFKKKNPEKYTKVGSQKLKDSRHNEVIDQLFGFLANENLDDLNDSLKALLLKGTILLGLPFIKEFAVLNQNNKTAIFGINDLLNDADESISLRAKFALSLLDQYSHHRTDRAIRQNSGK